MELSVTLMLALLGVLTLSGIIRWITETVAPRSNQQGHLRPPTAIEHTVAEEALVATRMDRTFGPLSIFQALRPFIVGIVHGLAGSAALVLTTIRVPFWAVFYLVVFGIGTVAGMIPITAAVALPFTISGSRFVGLNRGLGVASGLISFGFGLFILYQMGFVSGLFTGSPVWVPRWISCPVC
jgi:hypothetical protein